MNMRKKLSNPFVVLSAFCLLAGFFSIGYYHIDEHYQILEFVHYLLNPSSTESLPWEYSARIRPWIQPFVYMLFAKTFGVIGIESPYILEVIFRLSSVGLFIFAIKEIFGYLADEKLINDRLMNPMKWMFCLFWIFPFMSARISSEVVGGSLFVIGLIGLLRAIKSLSIKNIVLSSFLIGLAVWIRFQLGAAVLGILLWYSFLSKKFDIKVFGMIAAGGIAAALIGMGIDCYIYGEFTMTPYNYFARNILEGEAARHGVQPWWEYFYVAQKKLHPVFGVFYVVSFLFFWVKNPKSPFSLPTLLFFLLHMATAHKEIRFLLPMAFFLPYFVFFFVEYALSKIKVNEKAMSWFFRLVGVYFIIFSFIAATRPQYQGVGVFKFLQNSEIKKVYTFSGIPMKKLTHNIEQSYYGDLPFEEIKVKKFSQIKDAVYVVFGRGGREAILFQENGCQEIYPLNNYIYQKIHYGKNFHKRDFYSLYQCQK